MNVEDLSWSSSKVPASQGSKRYSQQWHSSPHLVLSSSASNLGFPCPHNWGFLPCDGNSHFLYFWASPWAPMMGVLSPRLPVVTVSISYHYKKCYLSSHPRTKHFKTKQWCLLMFTGWLWAQVSFWNRGCSGTDWRGIFWHGRGQQLPKV